MKAGQQGFTLIELVVVIVILGILAATALPKFVDLRTEAATAATEGFAGALSSSSSINYGARIVAPAKGVAIANCTDVESAMAAALPTGYAITAAAVAAGVSKSDCVLTNSTITPSITRNFLAIGVS